MQEPIEVGYQVFVSDGGEEFGAVREVSPNGRPELVIYVENGGDFIEEERRRARTLLIHLNNGTISELHGSYLMSFFISWVHNLGRFFAEVLFLKLRILEHLHYRILENLYRFLPLGEPQGERDGELVDERLGITRPRERRHFGTCRYVGTQSRRHYQRKSM